MKNSIPARFEIFAKNISEIQALKKQGDSDQVIKIIGASLNLLLEITPQEFKKLTELGLLAKIVEKSSTRWLPYKLTILIALLKETGDFAAAQKPPNGGVMWHLKALHLLLNGLAREDIVENWKITPTVESLLEVVPRASLSLETHILLIREFDRVGKFENVKTEFLLANRISPGDPKLIQCGVAFLRKNFPQTNTDRLANDSLIELIAKLITKC